jgi:hypothetical protein
MALGCAVSLIIALIFTERPLGLVLVIGLLIFFEFLAIAKGRAAARIFLIPTAFVPLMAISSLDLAYALVHNLIIGSVLALLLIFLVNALFPGANASADAGPASHEQPRPVAIALANAGVILSLFIYFMGAGTPASIIVIMVTAITILQQSATAGRQAALGLIVGNFAGGVAASIAYLLIDLLPSPAFLFLLVLLVGLLFGGKIASGGTAAAIHSVGLATFLTVLGLGLSPLPQDSSAIFFSRVVTIVVASLYTIGVASVLRALFGAVSKTTEERALEQS